MRTSGDPTHKALEERKPRSPRLGGTLLGRGVEAIAASCAFPRYFAALTALVTTDLKATVTRTNPTCGPFLTSFWPFPLLQTHPPLLLPPPPPPAPAPSAWAALPKCHFCTMSSLTHPPAFEKSSAMAILQPANLSHFLPNT